ncbi:sugar phosphate isomerase/epimerase [bacterium]|nr:sugar phosphate isomerase/epimerase [bacterium]
MRVGVSTHIFALWPLAKRHFEIIRESGFDAVELWAMAPHIEVESPGAVVWHGRNARAAGLDILSVHLPFYERYGVPDFRYLNLGDPDREAAHLAWRLCARVIAQMPSIGARLAVLHGPGNRAGTDEELCELYAEDLAKTLTDARERGVTLCLENVMTRLSSGEHIARFVDEAGENVAACLDVGHANVVEDAVAAASLLGPRVATLHIHDNHGTGDDHLLPGEGTIDWPALRDAITRAGDPNIILEIAWPTAGDIDEAAFAARLDAGREAIRRHLGV